MKTIEGFLSAADFRFGLVVSRFNETITRKLLDGALDGLVRHGASPDNVTIIWVPGAFELPVVARKTAGSGQYDAILCLGAVIRGDTPHFDFVAAEAAKGIAISAMESGIPIAFGVLTTDTIEQAFERSGIKSGNKGWDAALTAIEMADLYRKLLKD
ncbi:6,7-dimethyl-8-ribityllumazine synthase [bacterium]|nr:6,7-dimethyl-8-ribityllumazine synthase [candidate division CSSED10-310 bacterium]